MAQGSRSATRSRTAPASPTVSTARHRAPTLRRSARRSCRIPVRRRLLAAGDEDGDIARSPVDQRLDRDSPVRAHRATIDRVHADARVRGSAPRREWCRFEATLRDPPSRRYSHGPGYAAPPLRPRDAADPDPVPHAAQRRLEDPLVSVAADPVARMARFRKERAGGRHGRTQPIPYVRKTFALRELRGRGIAHRCRAVAEKPLPLRCSWEIRQPLGRIEAREDINGLRRIREERPTTLPSQLGWTHETGRAA